MLQKLTKQKSNKSAFWGDSVTAQLQTGQKLKHAKDCTEISFKGVED